MDSMQGNGKMKKELLINKKWAMPNKNTFSIKPINEIVHRYKKGYCIDPFSNNNKIADLTNDIDPDHGADFCMDALEFLKSLESNSVDTVLFDPPYSPRQVSESYKKMNLSVNMSTTQASFWGNLKKEIARVTNESAIVITCGWNSGGIGKSLGFQQVEILLVSHGGWHNDTIVTIEKKEV